jgi:hypothetical protein
VDWAYDPAIGLGDLASSEAAAYPFNKEDPVYKLWNGVVHKKAAYVVKFLAMGLDVLVCAHQLHFHQTVTVSPCHSSQHLFLFTFIY